MLRQGFDGSNHIIPRACCIVFHNFFQMFNFVENCAESVRIWSFSGSYSVRMRENTNTPNTDTFHTGEFAELSSMHSIYIVPCDLWKFSKWTFDGLLKDFAIGRTFF